MSEEQRIIELEIRFSHLDSFVSELNSVVVEQQKIIEKLQREILDMKKSVGTGEVAPSRTLADDKPPHY